MVDAAPPAVTIGRLVGIGTDGVPLVDFPANPAGKPVPAIAGTRFDMVPAGTPVALMFLAGDSPQPLILGPIANPPAAASEQPPESLTITAGREIVLQCGRANLVLTRAGKVLLRGAYLSLRSSGMQRITGASVHIN